MNNRKILFIKTGFYNLLPLLLLIVFSVLVMSSCQPQSETDSAEISSPAAPTAEVAVASTMDSVEISSPAAPTEEIVIVLTTDPDEFPTPTASAEQIAISLTNEIPLDWIIYDQMENPSFTQIKPELRRLRKLYLTTFSKPGWLHINKKVENFRYQFDQDHPGEGPYNFPEEFFNKTPAFHFEETWTELNSSGLWTGENVLIFSHLDGVLSSAYLHSASFKRPIQTYLNADGSVGEIIPPLNEIEGSSAGIGIENSARDYLENLENYQSRKSMITVQKLTEDALNYLEIILETPTSFCMDSEVLQEKYCGYQIVYHIDLSNGLPIYYRFSLIGESGQIHPEVQETILTMEIVQSLPPYIENLQESLTGLAEKID